MLAGAVEKVTVVKVVVVKAMVEAVEVAGESWGEGVIVVEVVPMVGKVVTVVEVEGGYNNKLEKYDNRIHI